MWCSDVHSWTHLLCTYQSAHSETSEPQRPRAPAAWRCSPGRCSEAARRRSPRPRLRFGRGHFGKGEERNERARSFAHLKTKEHHQDRNLSQFEVRLLGSNIGPTICTKPTNEKNNLTASLNEVSWHFQTPGTSQCPHLSGLGSRCP